MQEESDYYKILSVEPTASQKEVDRAAEELMSVWSSKTMSDPGITPAKELEIMAQISNASAVLTDPVKRLEYDLERGHRKDFEVQAAGKGGKHTPLPSRWSESIEALQTVKLRNDLDLDKLEKVISAAPTEVRTPPSPVLGHRRSDGGERKFLGVEPLDDSNPSEPTSSRSAGAVEVDAEVDPGAASDAREEGTAEKPRTSFTPGSTERRVVSGERRSLEGVSDAADTARRYGKESSSEIVGPPQADDAETSEETIRKAISGHTEDDRPQNTIRRLENATDSTSEDGLNREDSATAIASKKDLTSEESLPQLRESPMEMFDIADVQTRELIRGNPQEDITAGKMLSELEDSAIGKPSTDFETPGSSISSDEQMHRQGTSDEAPSSVASRKSKGVQVHVDTESLILPKDVESVEKFEVAHPELLDLFRKNVSRRMTELVDKADIAKYHAKRLVEERVPSAKLQHAVKLLKEISDADVQAWRDESERTREDDALRARDDDPTNLVQEMRSLIDDFRQTVLEAKNQCHRCHPPEVPKVTRGEGKPAEQRLSIGSKLQRPGTRDKRNLTFPMSAGSFEEEEEVEQRVESRPQSVSAITRIAGVDLQTVYHFGPQLADEMIEVFVNGIPRARIVRDREQDVYCNNAMTSVDLPPGVDVCASTVISANGCVITTEVTRRGKREAIAVYKDNVLLCRTGNTLID